MEPDMTTLKIKPPPRFRGSEGVVSSEVVTSSEGLSMRRSIEAEWERMLSPSLTFKPIPTNRNPWEVRVFKVKSFVRSLSRAVMPKKKSPPPKCSAGEDPLCFCHLHGKCTRE